MKQKKLLIIDNEPPYGAELKVAGYETLEAGDAYNALKLISRARRSGSDFDLIVAAPLRLGMSSLFDLIKNMKNRGIFIPVCAVSSCSNNMDNVALIYLGCIGFISGAIEPGRIIEFVDDILCAPPLGA